MGAGQIIAANWTRGPLAYLLKNRCYIGEVVYRGEIHKGEHEPIIERALFDAAQERLCAQALARKVANTASSSLLKGLLFDDAGNAMSPSHSNKKGVRYRYYVSQALLQDRPKEAGSVTRVSAPDVEQLVLDALQNAGRVDALKASEASVREQVARVVVEGKRLIVTLHPRGDDEVVDALELAIPFSPRLALRKGVAHAPASREPVLDPQSRETLLRAIARACRLHDAMLEGETSLDEIANAEGLAERYVRRLATLAFLSPKIIGAIADGSAPASLTPSSLSEALPLSWAEQERAFLSN